MPIIDYLDGLKQPHNEKIDFSYLPHFGRRVYKLIHPEPGKFEGRAKKGWFVGFERTTSKNYLKYHLHWTPQRRWNWKESCTPHVRFNEDEIFGDQLNFFGKQNTISLWSSSNLTPLDRVPSISNIIPQENQTPYKFEGEQVSNQSSDKQYKSSNEDIHIPAPEVPCIPEENWPQQQEDLTDTIVRPSSPV